MLYNTYRPHRFDEMVGQRAVVENLQSQSKVNRWFGVYIFCGQYGSGKTSMARIVALAVNCKHKDENGNPCCECEDCRAILEGSSPDVIEIAAAVNTGVDKVRELCDTVSYLPTSLTKKIYIIDEVHALSKQAFQAFLKMLEEPPEHVIFILATTDVAAIPATVRSRAATYYFSQLTQEEISGHLREVAGKEHLAVTPDACDVIAKYSQGSMRNALSLLDMAVQENNGATGETVEKLLGVSTPDALFSIIGSILKGMTAEVIQKTTKLIEGGADIGVMVSDMLSIAADLAVTCVSPDVVKGTEHYLSLLRQTALAGDSVRFALMAEALLDAKTALRKQADSAILIVSLVKLSRNGSVAVPESKMIGDENCVLRQMVASLEERMHAMEEMLKGGVCLSEDMTFIEKESSEEQFCACDSECEVEDESLHNEDENLQDKEVQEQEEISMSSVETSESVEVVQEPEDNDCYEDEDDFFAFLAMDDDYLGKKTSKTGNPILERLAKEEDAFRAALACCEVNEDEKGAVITATFPAVKQFLLACLSAYAVRGIDVSGINVA